MQKFRGLVSALAIIVLLFACVLLLPPKVQTHRVPPSQETIKEYYTKLAHARSIQVELNTRIICIATHDSELTLRSDTLEKKLEVLLRQRDTLTLDVARYRSEQDSFRTIYDVEQKDYVNLRNELASYKAQKEAQEADLRDCKSRWYIPNFMCDLANSIAYLLGIFEQVEGKINLCERRMKIAWDGMNIAGQRQTESQIKLDSVMQQSNDVQALGHLTENEITSIKSTLSSLRIEFQSYRNLLDDFENVLKEGATVDISDAHSSTKLKIIRISTDVDTAVAHFQAPANPYLPIGWEKDCSHNGLRTSTNVY